MHVLTIFGEAYVKNNLIILLRACSYNGLGIIVGQASLTVMALQSYLDARNRQYSSV